jgi:hypothetical protein
MILSYIIDYIEIESNKQNLELTNNRNQISDFSPKLPDIAIATDNNNLGQMYSENIQAETAEIESEQHNKVLRQLEINHLKNQRFGRELLTGNN